MTPPRITPLPSKCGQKLYTRPVGWSINRPPECNRPVGHPGEHREYDRRTAEVRAEWGR